MPEKNKDKSIPLYKTYPLAENKKRTSESGASIPPEDGVKEAKDWVDFNEK